MTRAIQEKLLSKITNQLTELAGISFYGDNMSNLPVDCLHMSDCERWCSSATRISMKYTLPDENDLESAIITLDFDVKIGDDRSLDDIYKILDALKTITNTDLSIYLSYSEGSYNDKSFNSLIRIDRVGHGTLLTQLETTDDLINTLYDAYNRKALSIICIRTLKEIDKKYPDFLISRGAIHLKGDWYAIIDNE